VGFQNSATAPDLGFYAARSYSLMRPPRDGPALDPLLGEARDRVVGPGAGGAGGCAAVADRCSGPRTGPGRAADAVR